MRRDPEKNIFEAYISAIRRKHDKSNPQERSSIRKGLELVISSPLAPKNNEPLFSGAEARRIRKKAGLTSKELSQQLGVPQSTIGNYEARGIKKPRGWGNKETIQKYLSWLKKQGYNPFNL